MAEAAHGINLSLRPSHPDFMGDLHKALIFSMSLSTRFPGLRGLEDQSPLGARPNPDGVYRALVKRHTPYS